MLVVLVISALLVGGIYRLFVAQTRAYTVQDQVVEVQQSIRGAMEIMLRDFRLAGFDSDSINSRIDIPTPVLVGDHSVTVSYEYDDTTQFTVVYQQDAAAQTLTRQLTTTKDDGTTVAGPQEVVLLNVEALDFMYGVDANPVDGAMDAGGWISATTVNNRKVVAVQVTLTARAAEVNPDLQVTSPRTLVTAVTLRNQCLRGDF